VCVCLCELCVCVNCAHCVYVCASNSYGSTSNVYGVMVYLAKQLRKPVYWLFFCMMRLLMMSAELCECV
jgi:hypothetical protein